MRIQTRGNSTTVWLSSGEGVINGTMSLSAPTLEKILQAVNEKYGTSFESWSQLPTVYEVGGTVPNWNAYEKIEFEQIEFVKYKIAANGNYMAGHIDYNTMKLKIWSQANQQALVQFNSEGEWTGAGGYPSWNTDFLNAVIAKGINVESAEFEDIPNMQPHDTIQNWSEYIEV